MEKITKLKVVNANQKEFEDTYREITGNFMSFEHEMKGARKTHEFNESFLKGIGSIISILNDMEESTEEILLAKKQLEQDLVRGRQVVDSSVDKMKSFEERYDRSKQFIELFKDGIVIGDDGETTLSEGVLMMIEFMHSIGRITEDEDLQKQAELNQQ